MWPAFTQKYVDVARWSKKLPTPDLVHVLPKKIALDTHSGGIEGGAKVRPSRDFFFQKNLLINMQ
jgi:hypothetical protein